MDRRFEDIAGIPQIGTLPQENVDENYLLPKVNIFNIIHSYILYHYLIWKCYKRLRYFLKIPSSIKTLKKIKIKQKN